MERVFPCKEWQRRHPEELGFFEEKLRGVESWMTATGEPFRVVIARHGYLAAEWNYSIDAQQQIPQASAAKSCYSCLLAIAVSEGKIYSLDASVIDYYPEMIDIREGEGSKPGRHALDKDRQITFRQLICNTSGYMKPGEGPGRRFHYQTFGMNVLTNALATIYGLYDSRDPGRLAGCAQLIKDKLRDPIGGSWGHEYTDFDYRTEARKNIFGHFLQILASARDAARIGQLWLNWGNWNGQQVVPSDYLHQATVTNPDILANEPEEHWRYGHGFWVNDRGKQWPDLPRDSYAAWGGGARNIWVCPGLDLVVALNPGPWTGVKDESGRLRWENDTLARILEAVVD